MNILLLDGYFGGSHVQWGKSLKKYSKHKVDIYSLSANHWKWRMQGAAVTFAKKLRNETPEVDLFLCTDMLNLPLFKSLVPQQYRDVPMVLYMHENQLTYPWSPNDPEKITKRDAAYGFINYSSALVADRVLYNSKYHLNSFLAAKNHVESNNEIPILLWNHRWEYDKDPETFFSSLFQLKENNVRFNLAVIGREYERQPEIFKTAKEMLSSEIVQYGYVESADDYYKWLWKSDILPVTNQQDFFGISVVEAIACHCFPLLPKKLSYGEHLDIEKHPTNFYDEGQLYPSLEHSIQSQSYKDNLETANQMEKYNWEKLIDQYDDCFAEMLAKK